MCRESPSPQPSPRKSGAREKEALLVADPNSCPFIYIVSERADCHTRARRVVGSRVVWLGFSAPPGKPDALQFLCVHFSVPAGGAGGLFRARPRRQSGPGGVAGAWLACVLCPPPLAICFLAAC